MNVVEAKKGFTVIPLSVTFVYLLTFISLLIEHKKSSLIKI
ncbi:hypothetical protein ACT7C7_14380 [Bacillus cereus]